MEGETTFLAFSESIHCNIIRAEKQICAKKPSAYMFEFLVLLENYNTVISNCI